MTSERGAGAVLWVAMIFAACAPSTSSPDPETPPCDGHDGGDGTCRPVGDCIDGFMLLSDGRCAGWVSVGSLALPRDLATVTELDDGRLLVVGGQDDEDSLALPAETIDPSSGATSMVGALQSGRIFHSASIIGSGKVLVTGGTPGLVAAEVTTSEVFDPSAGTWETVSALPGARFEHLSVPLPDGSALVFGGVRNPAAPALQGQRFDPVEKSWHTESEAPWVQRSPAIPLPDGRWIIAGGNTGSSEAFSAAVYLLDPDRLEWTELPPLSLARNYPAVAPISDELVLVAGGTLGGPRDAVDVVAVDGSGSATAEPLPFALSSPRAWSLGERMVAVVGAPRSAEGLVDEPQCWVYVLDEDRWIEGPPLLQPRLQPSWVITRAGEMHLVGGRRMNGSEVMPNKADMVEKLVVGR